MFADAIAGVSSSRWCGWCSVKPLCPESRSRSWRSPRA